MERDRFMEPSEAKEFGIIDEVLVHPPKPGVEPDKNWNNSCGVYHICGLC